MKTMVKMVSGAMILERFVLNAGNLKRIAMPKVSGKISIISVNTRFT